jgi:hypothetical protein
MLCYVTMNETKHACYIEIEIFWITELKVENADIDRDPFETKCSKEQ